MKNRSTQAFLLILAFIFLVISIVLPLGRLMWMSVIGRNGEFVGLSNFQVYFHSPSLSNSLLHTVFISLGAAIPAILLSYIAAWAITRTRTAGKDIFHFIILLPLFAPTMMHGIAAVYLFGKQGLVTTGCFGHLGTGCDIGIYGPVGIILCEFIWTMPQAFLIFMVAFSTNDNRLYEAAESMGASTVRQFFTVTLPGTKNALISASFACFTLSFTDFGAPKVVGGNYNVLATDIYKQVVGQQNMSMGAVVGILLLLPAAAAFIADRFAYNKETLIRGYDDSRISLKDNKWRDRLAAAYLGVISLGILIFTGVVVYASFIAMWPYNLTFTWKNFSFTSMEAFSLVSYGNSLLMSALTAVIGAAVVFAAAYMFEKISYWKFLRRLGYSFALLPLAVPGLVIGISYIMFFNIPGNPFYFIYGTAAILVLANIIHFFTVPFITANTALQKLDDNFESISESLGAPFYKTFFRVSLPLSRQALVEIIVYFFINSMVTVSAVIFLYPSDFHIAAVSIVNLDDAGHTAQAAAMSVLVLGTNIMLRLFVGYLCKLWEQKGNICHV